MSYRNNSSDTDDDPPRKNYSRMGRSGNGRNVQQASYASYERGHINNTRSTSPPQVNYAEELRKMEENAYVETLRVFAAQDAAITWEKEACLSDLRKYLHITEETHRAVVGNVARSAIVVAIRDWMTKGLQGEPGKDFAWREQQAPSSMEAASPVGGMRKKQKMASIPAQSAPALHPPPKQQMQPPPQQQPTPMPPPAPRGRTGPLTKGGRKPGRGARVKGGEVEEQPPPPPPPGPQTSGKRKEPPPREQQQVPVNTAPVNIHPHIGRLVETFWPDNGGWCKAVVADYKADEGLFCLIYDMNTPDETFEWVDLQKMGPNEYRFLDLEPVLLHQRLPTTSGGGVRGGGGGRGGSAVGRRGGGGSAAARGQGRGGQASSPVGKGVRTQLKPPPSSQTDDGPPPPSRGTLRRTGPAANGTSRGLPNIPPPPFNVPLEKLTETEDPAELQRSRRLLDEREQVIRRALQEIGPGSSDEDTDDDGGPAGNPGSSREFSPSPGGRSGGGSARGSRMVERRGEWGHEEDSHGNHYDDPSGDDYGRGGGGGRYHRHLGSGSNDDDDD